MEGARSADAGDIGAMASLVRAAIAELSELRGGALWQLQAARQEPVEDGLASDIANDPHRGRAVVGTVDDVVVGYGVSRLETLADGSVLSVISDLYVSPTARGIGVGEALVGELVAHAERQGAVGIDSIALPGDRATKNFFETFGLKARAIVVHRSLAPNPQDTNGGA